MQVSDFDQITGLSGTGAYLLSRSEQPALYVALCNAVDALVELVIADQPVPRWHTPASCLFDDEARKAYPYGNLNCGLAHGLPGILAFLSLVRRSGVSVPEETGEGIDRAIETAATWMQAIRLDDAWGVNWPSAVPLEPEGEPGPDKPMRCGDPRRAAGGPARAAWCYGAPGIARALWLAGEARSRPEWKELAISAMEAVFRRPVPVRQIDSPTFCHGVAGLLAITLRFAADTGLQIFVEQADSLTHQMLDRFQPESLLGFRNIEYDNNETDQPGLLDGAAGVAIVLLQHPPASSPCGIVPSCCPNRHVRAALRTAGFRRHQGAPVSRRNVPVVTQPR